MEDPRATSIGRSKTVARRAVVVIEGADGHNRGGSVSRNLVVADEARGKDYEKRNADSINNLDEGCLDEVLFRHIADRMTLLAQLARSLYFGAIEQ